MIGLKCIRNRVGYTLVGKTLRVKLLVLSGPEKLLTWQTSDVSFYHFGQAYVIPDG